MKIIKILRLMIVGLIGCFSLTDGMLVRTSKAARTAYQNPAMRSAALRRARTTLAEEESLPVTQKPTQGWGEWARSFFTKKAPSPVPAVATSFSRPSGYHPFGRTGQRRYYSSLVPTTKPEDSSSVELTEVSEGPGVPKSFEPSLKSKFPYTTEYEIEKLFETLNQKLRAGSRSGQVTLQDIRKFEDLVSKSGYNPINRQIQGQPSFFAKILEYVFRNESNVVYFRPGGAKYVFNSVGQITHISDEGRQMLQQCFSSGARFRKGEIEKVLQDFNMNESLQQIIENIDMIKIDAPLSEINDVASRFLYWYDFFNAIGFDLTKSYWRDKDINIDAMRDIVKACTRLSKASEERVTLPMTFTDKNFSPNLLHESLFYFSPACEIIALEHRPLDPTALSSLRAKKYKIINQNTEPGRILNELRQNDKFVSMFVSQAKKAGFFKSEDVSSVFIMPKRYLPAEVAARAERFARE